MREVVSYIKLLYCTSRGGVRSGQYCSSSSRMMDASSSRLRDSAVLGAKVHSRISRACRDGEQNRTGGGVRTKEGPPEHNNNNNNNNNKVWARAWALTSRSSIRRWRRAVASASPDSLKGCGTVMAPWKAGFTRDEKAIASLSLDRHGQIPHPHPHPHPTNQTVRKSIHSVPNSPLPPPQMKKQANMRRHPASAQGRASTQPTAAPPLIVGPVPWFQ